MPLSSYQVSGMMSSQQQMFANYAAYAGQISPEGPPGMSGYGAPLGQQAPMGPGVSSDFGAFNAGPRAMAGMHAAMPAMMGAGILAGSFLPGALGRGIGRLDPFQAGLSGFGSASGLTGGIKAGAGMGEMFGGMAENLGRIGAGGIGNIARAGMVGIGGAAVAALPPFIGMKAIEYMGGKMVEGAQFTNQVQRTLGQNFRFNNPLSQTGSGFSREQGAEIAGTIRQMGNREIMSSPQEMLRIMEQGIQGGLFRPVQDAKAFQAKFKEMVGALKEVAKTFNTTLEGAMPFLQEGRRMGFWTPSDVMRMAASTRATAATTGMTVAQVQQMQEQGAGMARSVGAQGAMGALGMQRTMDVVGGGVRSGVISEQRMAELTGGLQGSEAIASLSGTLQAGTTRFAASRTARWLLAATANKSMTGLDEGKLGMLSSGRLSIDQIRGMAEKGVQGHGADFVMGEEEMRGELLKKGPEAQAGFIAGIAGKRLYGDSAMDKLVTRRLIQRFFGGDARQADTMAELARHMPQILRDNSRRAEADADRVATSRDEMMEHSYEGLKRKVASWTKQFVEDPLLQAGSQFSQAVGDQWEKVTDKIWGRAPRGLRAGGVTRIMADALRSTALGNTGAARHVFATAGEMNSTYGAGTSNAQRLSMVQEQIQTQAQAVVVAMGGGGAVGSGQTGGLGALGGPESKGFHLPSLAEASYMVSGEALKNRQYVLGGGSRPFVGAANPDSILDLYKGGSAEDFKRALLDFSAQDRGEDPEGYSKGKAGLKAAAEAARRRDTPESRKEAELLENLANKPESHAALAKLGNKEREWSTISGTGAIVARMGRARDELARGGQFEDRIRRFNEFTTGTGKGAKSAGIGDIIRSIVTEGQGGNLNQVQLQDKLKHLSQASMGLGAEQAAMLQAQLSGPGMEAFGQMAETVGGTGDLLSIKKAFDKKGNLGAQSKALSEATSDLGLPAISQQAIAALRSKKPTAKQTEILEKLQAGARGLTSDVQDQWKKLLGDVKIGDVTGITDFVSGAKASSRAGMGSDPGVDRLAAWKKTNFAGANVFGTLGSTEGMHKELVTHTALLTQIASGVKGSPDVGAPSSKPDDGGFVGPKQG